MNHQIEMKVCQIIGISHERYCWVQFNSAYKYLEHLELDDWSISFLTTTKAFWKWYCKQFHLRDERFIQMYREHQFVKPIAEWKLMHHPERIISFVPKEVYETAYSQMANEAIKEQMNSSEKVL